MYYYNYWNMWRVCPMKISVVFVLVINMIIILVIELGGFELYLVNISFHMICLNEWFFYLIIYLVLVKFSLRCQNRTIARTSINFIAENLTREKFERNLKTWAVWANCWVTILYMEPRKVKIVLNLEKERFYEVMWTKE